MKRRFSLERTSQISASALFRPDQVQHVQLLIERIARNTQYPGTLGDVPVCARECFEDVVFPQFLTSGMWRGGLQHRRR